MQLSVINGAQLVSFMSPKDVVRGIIVTEIVATFSIMLTVRSRATDSPGTTSDQFVREIHKSKLSRTSPVRL